MKSLGGIWTLGVALLLAAATAADVAAQGQPPLPGVPGLALVRDIRVEGAQRIDPTTVRSYMTINPGDPFDATRVNQSLKSLYATGLFADVSMRREGDSIVVAVVENPVINRLAFEGNQDLEDEDLAAEVQLRERVVFTRTRAQSDVQRILDLYRRSGRFGVRVEPKVIRQPQNRVDLVFEIDEGDETGISRILFVGNRRFSDGELRDEILTAESRWWDLFSASDTYDPDRLNFDRELLRRFYLKNGYADFRVLSAVAELTPERDDFVITFTIEEGERYRFGAIDISTRIPGLDVSDLRGSVLSEQGEWYDAELVENSISALTDAVGNLGYAFVDIRPVVDRDPDRRTISITYEIGEGPRVFVERIDIKGNTRTKDEVIRREFRLVEGDAFNTSKLRRSRQRVQNLGFFSGVDVTNVPGSSDDRTVVEVDVEEQSTGELSFGLGFSSVDGPLGDISIRERNLLGQGQELRLAFTGSARTQQIDLGFTEPYLLGRPVAGGVDLFRIQRDQQDESSFDEDTTGFRLRSGYAITEHLRQNLRYGFRIVDITEVDANASLAVRENEGETTISEVGQTLLYDRRDNRFNPSSGYFARLSNDVAGLGGDVSYWRSRIDGGYYIPFFDNALVIGLTGEVGYIRSLDNDAVRLSDRFYVGGNNLRGFEVSGIGPRDVDTNDSLGGNRYYVASAQARFPLGLPEELGITGRAFVDAGSLWDVDTNVAGIADEASVRLSAGLGIGWNSPFGPISIDYAFPILKENFDQTERIRVNFGTNF